MAGGDVESIRRTPEMFTDIWLRRSATLCNVAAMSCVHGVYI